MNFKNLMFWRKKELEEESDEEFGLEEEIDSAAMFLISIQRDGQLKFDVMINDINKKTTDGIAMLLLTAHNNILLSQLLLLLNDLKEIDPEYEQLANNAIVKFSEIKAQIEKTKEVEPYISPMKAFNKSE